MAVFEITVEVQPNGDGTTADDVVSAVLEGAARLSLPGIRDVWPVKTGRSKAGLRVDGPAVVGSVSYTDEIRRHGSRTTIVNSGELVPIGERAAQEASQNPDVADRLDAVIAESLTPLES